MPEASVSLWFARAIGAALVVAVGCSSVSDPTAASPGTKDAGELEEEDAGTEAVGDASASTTDTAPADAAPNLGTCAATFGDALTAAFGRIDGKLVAIVVPGNQACAMPNSDHLVVQVEMKGAVYRVVVNVESDRGSDRTVRYRTLDAPLGTPAWEEGWHAGLTLDYVALGAHAGSDFTSVARAEFVSRVIGELHVGDPISIYATSGSGRPDSVHLVHRNDGKADGTIVVDPKGQPRHLLFHFADQTF